MSKSVAILGGGVAGLSAAHELVKRGFDVHVYEAGEVVGGKARSLGVVPSGTEVDLGGGHMVPLGEQVRTRKKATSDLPGEHGFRFFPGFYKHLPAMMEEIEVDLVSAFDHLAVTTETLLARQNGQSIFTANQFPNTVGALIDAFESFSIFYCEMGIPKREVTDFVRSLLKMLVSCDQRRFQQYENTSWFDFLEASGKSNAFQLYLAKGLSRSLVALNAEDLSARTGACILLQFIMDFVGGTPVDRVLDLPTNAAWLTPWREQLELARVNFHMGCPVVSIQCDGTSITNVQVDDDGSPTTVTADYYIAAVPVEKMRDLLNDDILTADETLKTIRDDLCTEWMTGILFFLNRDVPIVAGHANYLDSWWALTSISQAQFWDSFNFPQLGQTQIEGVLSVIISNWEQPLAGGQLAAKDCNPEEVIASVWQQLKDHLNTSGTTLSDSDVELVFLAPCLSHDENAAPGQQWANDEPLFINTKGSWPKRPTATTKIPNFFLASDYVQTYTDLATMESATEAARRAVNGILARENRPGQCPILPLDEPRALTGFRWMDQYLFKRGMEPPVPPLPTLPWPC